MTSSEVLTRPGSGAGAGPGPVPPARGHRWPAMPLRAAAPAAVGGGLLAYLAFPGHDLWPLAPVGVAALVLAVAGQGLRRAALLGWLFGAAMVVPLISWTGIYLGPIAWLPLSGMEGLYYALAGAGIAAVQRLPWRGARGGAVRALGSGGVWVAAEALQGRWPFGGFEWTRLVFSQADAPTLGLAAVGGAPLVSFAVVVAGALLAEAVRALLGARRSAGPRSAGPRSAVLVSAGPAAAALAVLGLGALVPVPTAAQPVGARAGTLDVAAVQGDVPTAGLDFNAQRRAVLDNHARATQELARAVAAGETQRPDLVVWPENASDIDPFANPDAAEVIDGVVDGVGAPLLLGTLRYREDGRIDNTSLLWEPGVGATQSYVKRHPVPFAEYIPYRAFFRRISAKVDLVARDFAPGTEVGVIDVPLAGGPAGTVPAGTVPAGTGPAGTGPAGAGLARLGVLICFEVVDDALVADAIDAGAQILVVQTNNATFGYTDESVQQLAMSRVRAVETGRAVVHVSTVGVSSLVLPDGTATQRTAPFEPALLRGQLPLRTSATVATSLRRAGVPVEGVLGAVGLLAAGAGVLSRRRASR